MKPEIGVRSREAVWFISRFDAQGSFSWAHRSIILKIMDQRYLSR